MYAIMAAIYFFGEAKQKGQGLISYFSTRSNAPRWNAGFDALRHSKLFVWTQERPVAGFQHGTLEPGEKMRGSTEKVPCLGRDIKGG